MTESISTMSVEGAPENDTQHESTFSAASMFGMLLTMSTCLLLQPQGSLIFKKPSNVFGRILFFCLRLNPTVCLIEAASVLYALVLILQRAIRSCHGNLYRDFGVFTTNLQAGTAGLLFLRSHTGLRPWDGDPQLDEKLVGPAPKRGHTEMAIDVLTLLSVVGTIVKLTTSVVSWYFRVVSWCYIGGWIVVQLAVMVSHCGPSKELLDPEALLRSAEHLQQRVDNLESVGRISMVIVMCGLGFLDHFHELHWHSLVLPAIMALLLMGNMKFEVPPERWEVHATLTLLFAFLVTIATFVVALVWYEEEGTLKPEWLDWLG